MPHPEKNDVDIYKLFHWGREFSIVDRFGKELTKVYIRLNGDSELNRARVFALRRSAELRKKLKTEGTDERVAFISTIFDIDEKSQLLPIISTLMTRTFAQEATKEVRIPTPKEPKSDATLEEQEKFQEEVDSYDDRKNEAVGQAILNKISQFEKELESQPVEKLQKQYERLMIDELCEREMITKFKEVSAFFGSYSDPDFKIPAFDSFELFENLPTEIKEQYIDNYENLEINIDELKKLQEAML